MPLTVTVKSDAFVTPASDTKETTSAALPLTLLTAVASTATEVLAANPAKTAGAEVDVSVAVMEIASPVPEDSPLKVAASP